VGVACDTSLKMLLDPRALKIYIDGSAFDNPGGRGGCAAIVEYPDDRGLANELLLCNGYRETNNQRMELRACVEVLRHVREHGAKLGVQRVLIITDSKYIYEGWSRAHFWKADGWRNAVGRPVENTDLWKEFLSVRGKVKVRTEIAWKKGKTTPILKEVDRHAKRAADQPWNIDRGFREGKISRPKLGRRSASSLFPARGQEVTVRIYRSGLVRRDEHKIYFELYSDAEKRLTEKYRAYASPDVAVDLHRSHWYRVQFNSNPNYPAIEAIVQETAPSS
jgi:ribonuclease HI